MNQHIRTMQVFMIASITPGPSLAATITQKFPGNNLQVSPTVWLVAGNGTAQEISNHLGITPELNTAVGTAVITSVSGYYGRAPNYIWEWIKAKLEAPNG